MNAHGYPNTLPEFYNRHRSPVPDPLHYKQPLSYMEHKRIYPNKYYQLGGLGPNIGSERWREGMHKLEQINEYSKNVRARSKSREDKLDIEFHKKVAQHKA